MISMFLTRQMPLIAAAGLLMAATQGIVLGQEREVFTALAANLSNIGTGKTGRVDISIDRWSTDEEREQLRVVLLENGTEALLKALQKMKPVGRIRVNDSLGWDLRYSREVKSASGRRIVFATDRPIGVAEARAQPRTIEYRFTVGDLRMVGDKGEGSLAVAVKVRFDKAYNVLELENFASEPIRLLEVRKIH